MTKRDDALIGTGGTGNPSPTAALRGVWVGEKRGLTKRPGLCILGKVGKTTKFYGKEVRRTTILVFGQMWNMGSERPLRTGVPV